MGKFVHGLIHVVATVAQVAAVASPLVPPEYKMITVAVGSLGQAILALVNHNDAQPVK